MVSSIRKVVFRFNEELNDHETPQHRKRPFTVEFKGNSTAGELVAALDVPTAEVDLLLVDGEASDSGHRLSGGKRVAAYSIFERFDITPMVILPGRPLPKISLNSRTFVVT